MDRAEINRELIRDFVAFAVIFVALVGFALSVLAVLAYFIAQLF